MGVINGFEITKASEILNKLTHYRKNYHERGMYLGWDDLDEHYSMQLGNTTDWTGFPMSGKTQVLMECLMNTSLWYGWEHLVYFPDVGNNIEIIADFIHKKTGMSFDPKAKNAISDAEIIKELDWITHHFKVLTKKEVKAKMSPMDFWDMAIKIKKETGLHTASIDSWKDMSHPYSEYGGYAQYLEYALPYRNLVAEEHNLHLHTVIHPKLTEKEKGKRVAPTPYDMKGGSEWFNSGKCMITVHREDLTDNRVEIYFNKIKPRSVGKIGMIEKRFDLDKFRYYDIQMISPNQFERTYAHEKGGKVVEQLKFEPLKPNTNFYEPKENENEFELIDDVPF
jgi:hypothetical protein